jgi:exopolyphosphatase / guanosine-5'-triphosphate,3'-diphosphate pyrophosphatase
LSALSNRRAIISLGTNTVRLLVIEDCVGGHVEQIEHLAVGTRLGEGLHEHGALREAAMLRTLEVVRSFTDVLRRHGASLVCIATSVMRRAENGADFAMRMREITGVPLRIITGEEEAAASFRGASYTDVDAAAVVDAAARIGVLDIGGGSTEYAVGTGAVLERCVSFEIGTVRLTERFPELRGVAPGALAFTSVLRAYAFVREALETLMRFSPPLIVRAVAGTPATIAAIVAGSDVEHVRGVCLARADVRSVLDRLLNATLTERRAIPGMLAQRADVLPAGAVILDTAISMLGCDSVCVETNDLLLGYLLRVAEQENGKALMWGIA